MSRRKMSGTSFVSPGTRSGAWEANATKRPSAESDGLRLEPFAEKPSGPPLTIVSRGGADAAGSAPTSSEPQTMARSRRIRPPILRAPFPLRAGFRTSAPSVVRHLVDGDRDGEKERVVLLRRDLDAVGVADAEPLLRHLRDRPAVALDLVLVVEHLALRVHVLAADDVDREVVAQRAHEGLLDRRDRVAVALDLHLVADGQALLLDRVELLAVRALEHERLPEPQRLPVDLEGLVLVLGLDPVVVADREHPLAHPVPGPAIVVAAAEERHMGRGGIEPPTLGLRVPCSAN